MEIRRVVSALPGILTLGNQKKLKRNNLGMEHEGCESESTFPGMVEAFTGDQPTWYRLEGLNTHSTSEPLLCNMMGILIFKVACTEVTRDHPQQAFKVNL